MVLFWLFIKTMILILNKLKENQLTGKPKTEKLCLVTSKLNYDQSSWYGRYLKMFECNQQSAKKIDAQWDDYYNSLLFNKGYNQTDKKRKIRSPRYWTALHSECKCQQIGKQLHIDAETDKVKLKQTVDMLILRTFEDSKKSIYLPPFPLSYGRIRIFLNKKWE